MIESFTVQQFRNLKSQSIQLAPGLNLFIGLNGQGKTNCIEALQYALSSGGIRHFQKSDLIQMGTEWARIKIHYLREQLNDTIEVQIQSTSKNHFLNQKRISVQKLLELYPILTFTPESLNSIKSSSESRRDLIDEALIVFQPRYYTTLESHRKILKQRNSLLKQISENEISKPMGKDLLVSLNQSFISNSAELAFVRTQFLNSIQSTYESIGQEIFESNLDVKMGFEYRISDNDALHFSEEKMRDLLHQRALELMDAEMTRGASLVGPQRHEIVFKFNNMDSRTLCSQGQQRTLILAFKLAQVVYNKRVKNRAPILLLDDVLSELDRNKRKALLKYLTGVNTQIILTTTDIEEFESQQIPKKVFRVQNGSVEEVKE